ncbi:hypothetical protein IE077_000812 [Cardiosporidium cionae]|uniref:NADH dehydrogenase subunit 6 n=1 Tax=Cardiosporidium cionae TaxID=476202 RepID=A0ABQ7JE02_9APIC|nr:hypothetical protein IE077_000812 [Cardiosporidium cionae]|eukprot:KAF8822199.1 hypothetical protein IE077_000812 [Cardiosporidium cionae]
MILGPLLIGKDVPAQVVTAVNALLILLSSSSLAVLVVVKGDVSWSYALLLGSICLVTAFLGKYFIDAWSFGDASSLFLSLLFLYFYSLWICLFSHLTFLREEISSSYSSSSCQLNIKRRNASYYLIFLLLGMIFVSFCTLAGTFIYNLVIGRAEPYGITFLCS